jgi:hypothetical protein
MRERFSSMRLPWVLLPFIGVMALLSIAVPLEFVARKLYNEPGPGSIPCLVMNDSSTGVRGIPNSVCHEKIYESPMAEYRFNGCGHRTLGQCDSKPPGTYRIVMVGSSVAEGFTVSYEQSIAGLLPERLSRATGRTVEIYNEGLPFGTPHGTLLRFDQVLAAHPDLILWPMTPWDINNVSLVIPTGDSHAALAAALQNRSRWERLKLQLTEKRDLNGFMTKYSRAYFMIQHLLYKSDSIYLAHSLSGTDPYASSLLETPAPEWQAKLDQFAGYLSDMAARSKAAGVPMVIVAVPRHAQGVLIAAGLNTPGIDPLAFGSQMQRIAGQCGVTYIDILQPFRGIRDINTVFYPVDQHLSARGQQVVADLISEALSHGIIPPAKSAH